MAATYFQEVIKWVAIPNGVSDDHLQVTVFIAPELSGGGASAPTLADYPDFADWPATLKNGRTGFEVTFTDTLGRSNTVVSVVGQNVTDAGGDIWPDLFTQDLTVEPRAATDNPSTEVEILGVPAQALGTFLTGQYAGLPLTDVPTFAQSRGQYAPIGPVAGGITTEERMAAQARERAVARVNNTRELSDPADAFAMHQRYFSLPTADTSSAPPPRPTAPVLDFHAALTFVGEHSQLQRNLGLVFDLTIATSELPFLADGAIPAANRWTVSVSPVELNGDNQPEGPASFGGGSVQYTGVSLPTSCYFGTAASGLSFEAYSDPANDVSVSGGQLIAGPLYYPYTFDLIGGAFKAANFAATLEKQDPGAIDRFQSLALQNWTPPALSSSGLSLAVTGWAGILQGQLVQQQEIFSGYTPDAQGALSGNPAPLQGTDLIRGLILDVYDVAAGTWYSTSARTVTYSSPNGQFDPFSANDEGGVSTPPRVELTRTGVEYYVSEEILHYNNWSNAAPIPGTPLPDSVTDNLAAPGAGVFADRLKISVIPQAGSLPRLRFGKQYELRVRVVDLANDVVSVDPETPAGVSGQITYGRLDPISAPDVYAQPDSPKGYPTMGAGPRRLVIRDIDVPKGAAAARLLAPPRSTVRFAETHGMFDTSNGGLDPNAAANVFNAPVKDYNSSGNATVPRESGQYPSPPALFSEQLDPTQPVPYLPDPLSRGGILSVAAGPSHPVTPVAFDFSPTDQWPNYRPVGLQVLDSGGKARSASYNASTRVVTVYLQPGDELVGTVKSTFQAADRAGYGLGDFFPSGTWNAMTEANAAQGAYWALTPGSPIELVYAVQKPLATPELSEIVTQHADTQVSVRGKLTWDPGTTGKLDFTATTSDPVDDPLAPAGSGPGLPGVPGVIAGPGVPNSAAIEPRTTQFWSWPAPGYPGPGIPSANIAPPFAGSGSEVITTDFTDEITYLPQELHDTKAHLVTYAAIATSDFAEFYDTSSPGAELSAADLQVQSANPQTVQVNASAPPAALSIAYVVPIYDWDGSPSLHDTKVTSGRSAAGVRVFIERPWWSSGNGEQLGVLCVGPGSSAPYYEAFDSNDSRYLSDWGQDPLFAGGPLPSTHPMQDTFTAAVTDSGDTTDLPILEDETVRVSVAPHNVAFDPEVNLWYSDIIVDIGQAYTPMLRLALARYQPNGFTLGGISLADIVTLDPARAVTVVNTKNMLEITLTGVSYTRAANVQTEAPGVVQILLQKADPAITDPDLAWSEVTGSNLQNPVTIDQTQGSNGTATVMSNGTAVWKTSIGLPGRGTYRLIITQYEVIPTDSRLHATQGDFEDGYRLVYQDIVPLTSTNTKVVHHPPKGLASKHPTKKKPVRKKPIKKRATGTKHTPIKKKKA